MGIREGCSQGFWSQERNLPNWVPTGFLPTDIFNIVFDRNAADPATTTLFQALNPVTPVTLLEQLIQQATAALLNAAHPDINYPLTVNEVISLFQAAFDSGDYETTKNLFDQYNNLFCPLDAS